MCRFIIFVSVFRVLRAGADMLSCRVAAKASTGEGQHSEIIPTREYLFRYDYGACRHPHVARARDTCHRLLSAERV